MKIIEGLCMAGLLIRLCSLTLLVLSLLLSSPWLRFTSRLGTTMLWSILRKKYSIDTDTVGLMRSLGPISSQVRFSSPFDFLITVSALMASTPKSTTSRCWKKPRDPLLRPDSFGRFRKFGKFGGKYVPETLMHALIELQPAFHSLATNYEFQGEE